MEAVLDRIPEQQVSALLAKLQAPPLHEIADMPTLVHVVQGLESIVNGSHPKRSLIKAVLSPTRETRGHSCVSCASFVTRF